MRRKLISVTVLVVAATWALLAVGCASGNGNQPYSLTGNQELTPEQQQWVDRNSIDEKGHYNTVKHEQALDQVSLANQENH